MKKHFLPLLLCLTLILAIAVFPVAASADFGGFSGDTDYGSSFDGGSFDYGDSYDYGSSSGGGLFILGGGGSDGCFGGALWWIIVAVVVIGFIVSLVKKKNSSHSRPVAPGAERTAAATLSPIEQYTALDPKFSAAALQEKLSNLYVQMQNCWQNKDIESLRPYLSDAIYEQMDRQLSAMRTQGRTNYIDRIAVLSVTLRGFCQQGEDDHMIAEIRTRIVDYTLDDKMGTLVSGSRSAEKFMTYEWELTRPSGQTTTEQGEMQSVHCPSCGAPVSINQSAKCPYCDSVITLSQHDWVISSIKGLSQRTAQ